MYRILIPAAVLCLLAGCNGGDKATAETPKREAKVVFDINTAFSFKNHFKKSTDPLGTTVVFQTADRARKMTFVQRGGFFTIPADHKGKVVLELLLQDARKVTVVMVGASKKSKSFHPGPQVEGKWFDLALPLADMKEKLAEGEKVVDITVWIKPDQKGQKLPAGAQMFIRRAKLVE